MVYTNQSALKQEENHIREALLRCSFPHGPLKDSTPRLTIGLMVIIFNWQTTDTTITTRAEKNNRNIFLVVPYTRGLSKGFKKTCKHNLGIQVYFRGNNTI